MKRRLPTLILAMMLCVSVVLLTACGSGPVGFWIIDEFMTGETVMTVEDAQSFGLSKVGSVKLQKSGNCVVELVGEESEGTWTQDDDGTINISYGDDKTLTGSIGEDGIMTLTDDTGATMKLSK